MAADGSASSSRYHSLSTHHTVSAKIVSDCPFSVRERISQRSLFSFAYSKVNFSSFLATSFLSLLTPLSLHIRLARMAPQGTRFPPEFDQCIIAVLKMLPLADQLRAGHMNRRWSRLLRDSNRCIRSLRIITGKEFYEEAFYDLVMVEYYLNKLSLDGTSRSLQMLKDSETGKPLHPIPGHLNKWNCLVMPFPSKNMHENSPENAITVAQIADAYSAITELTFATARPVDFEHLVELLEQNSGFRRQITSFTLIDDSPEELRIRMMRVEPLSFAMNRRLLAVINTGMPLLQNLSIWWHKGFRIFDLSVIAQLKFLSASCHSSNFDNLIYSLDEYAQKSVDLEIILEFESNNEVFKLSEGIRERVVRCWDASNLTGRMLKIASDFRSQVSVKEVWEVEDFAAFDGFEHLKGLPQLMHLDLTIELNDSKEMTRPMAVLRLVRALDLFLTISDHQQIDTLNLGRTMPNLEAICLYEFRCRRCNIDLSELNWDKAADRSPAVKCFRTVLPRLHASGLPLSRVVIWFGFDDYRTAEDVCKCEEK